MTLTAPELVLACAPPTSAPATSTVRIGAHVPSLNPLSEAAARDAEVIQLVMASPRAWRAPIERKDVAELRASTIPIYAHAPYLINFASGSPAAIEQGRQCLREHAEAAATIGARGLVVHAGHATHGADPAEGRRNWRETFEQWSPPLPILIENTANGDHAMARSLSQLEELWKELAKLDAATFAKIGFCLDTCHAHAGGVALSGVVERLLGITGRVDLVHANDSKDSFDSRRDRHEHLGQGQILPEALLKVINDAAVLAGAPAVVETEGAIEGQSRDIAWIRAQYRG